MKISFFIITFFLLTGVANSQWTEKNISISGSPGTLWGSWINTENYQKVILIIPGSGPTDRDGNSAMGMKNNSLKMLAESLAEENIPSLRIDKRGIGASKSGLIAEDSLKFDNLVNDVCSWTKILTDSLGYESVIIAGHSQGSLVGILASQQNQKVIGYISIAGAGEPIGSIIKRQIAKQAPVLLPETESIVDSLSNGFSVNKVNPFLLSVFRPSVQPFLISYMKYDPVIEISKLSVPVLIINGTTDLQVDPDNALRLDSGAIESQVLIIEGMNHVLKDAPEDIMKNMSTYNQPDIPLNQDLIPAVTKFIKSLK